MIRPAIMSTLSSRSCLQAVNARLGQDEAASIQPTGDVTVERVSVVFEVETREANQRQPPCRWLRSSNRPPLPPSL
jgi:hypothetical protein